MLKKNYIRCQKAYISQHAVNENQQFRLDIQATKQHTLLVVRINNHGSNWQ